MRLDPAPRQRIAGALLGTAVGDALGLPREGLSPRRARALFGPGPLRHALVAGWGMVSDDTEHACMVAQALLAAGTDPEAFARTLGRSLRWWMLALPAGIGGATLRASLRLWLGYPPDRSGVVSAGNGPAMRAPLLGLCAGADLVLLRDLVSSSTRLTHRHQLAFEGALTAAMAAAWAGRCEAATLDPDALLATLIAALEHELLIQRLDQVRQALRRGVSSAELARQWRLGNGITGFIADSVPMALLCWLSWPGDFRRAVEEIVLLGGDTDSTAALTGALAGATMGVTAIPSQWVAGVLDWPLSTQWLMDLAHRLAIEPDRGPLPFPGWARPLRNAIFTTVVLAHGLRRMLPTG